MGLPTKRPWSLKTFLVTISCLAGAGAGAYLLYRDITHVGDGGVGEPVAKVEKREEKVRRKSPSSYAWNNVATDQQLYWKDSIQTGPASSASIRLKDGSVVELGEASLVVMDQADQLSLNFLRGSIIVRKPSGEDTKVTVAADGKKKVEKLPARLLAPAHWTETYTVAEQSTPVDFSWKPMPLAPGSQSPETNGEFILQISKQRQFREKNFTEFRLSRESQGLGDKTMAQKAAFTAGTYFWRVVSPDGTPTEIRQFKVLAAKALQPLWPLADQRVKTFADQSAVAFRWAPPEQVHAGVKHRLEISAKPDFVKVLREEAVSASNGTATLKDFALGQYFWRIKSLYGSVTLTSPARDFWVEKSANFAVNLTSPADQASFETLPKYRFNWNSDAPEAEYTWEIQDKTGKTLAQQTSRATTAEWKDPVEGILKWKVTAKIGNDVVGESTWRSLSIYKGQPLVTLTPENEKALFYWTEPTPFQFSWKPDPLLEKRSDAEAGAEFSYLLEVARDAQFQSLIGSIKTSTPQADPKQIKDLTGTLYWRVKLLASTGQTLKTSATKKFQYGHYPTLAPPNKLGPETGKTYNVVLSEIEPKLEWNNVDQAQSYELTVYSVDARTPASSEKSKPYLQTILKETNYQFKNLPEGRYHWTVRAIDRLERKSEATSSRVFIVTYGEPLGAPQPKSKGVQ